MPGKPISPSGAGPGPMRASRDRRIALVLGILGAVLIAFEGFVDLVRSVVDVAVHPGSRFAAAPLGEGLLLLLLALLAGFFTLLGRGSSRDAGQALPGGALIVLALAGWLLLRTGSSVLSLAGTLLLLVSGVVYLLAGR